jgi:hypothetical protein
MVYSMEWQSGGRPRLFSDVRAVAFAMSSRANPTDDSQSPARVRRAEAASSIKRADVQDEGYAFTSVFRGAEFSSLRDG